MDESKLTPTQLADLVALADDSIAPERRAAVEAWIASSPDLQESYRRERAAVELVHAARTVDRAPEPLRRRIEQQRQARQRRARRRSLSLGVTLAGAVAAVAVALALILPAGTPGTPPVAEAAALATHGPTQPAPALDPRDPQGRLDQAVQDVYFPNWGHRLGWRAVGQRQDVLDGRFAITVYYGSGGRQLAYTIVATPALPQPHVAGTMRNGFDLRTLRLHGRTIVTWQRAGHTCVISASGVPLSVLQKLASYRAQAV
ncbi:MAG: hypothetical protein ACJ764_01120 [Solirubrobacteraceae bacterium]